MKIGILGAADIAFRRFLPALQACPEIKYAGVASRTPAGAERFIQAFGGEIYDSYDALLADKSIDAVYVPLPPALHYQWGKKVLESGKHLLMEKPFTTALKETEALLALAEKWGLAVHENYMFLYHSQMAKIKELIASEALGELRLIRAAFGFPKRAAEDFRYQKALGGGALLDCGGYPVRLALELLGETAQVTQAKLCQPPGYEVDLYGSAVLENETGLCAQISFGMDNSYKCELELWGSQGSLSTNRIFTAPFDMQPSLILTWQRGEELLLLPADNAFKNSLLALNYSVQRQANTQIASKKIRKQSKLIETIQREGAAK